MSVSMSEGAGYVQYSDEATTAGYQDQFSRYSSVCEIEEESPSENFEINHGRLPLGSIKEDYDQGSLFSLDIQNWEDCVYVAVGKSESSMVALEWALRHAVTPSTIVYLIHIFPEVQYIPTPLGKLPKSQVSPEQVKSYMDQERGKRRDILQKYIIACSSARVKLETILIESDMVAKAILDLIPILNIRKLVVGTTKSSLRKLKSRKGSGIADQMLQNGQEGCEVKIICEGKEVIDQMIDSPPPRTSDDTLKTESRSPKTPVEHSKNPRRSPSPKPTEEEDQRSDSFSCMCFKPKFK